MLVCARCHNKDKNAIGCDKDFVDHHEFGMFKCMVCGKRTIVHACKQYTTNRIEQLKKK